SASGCEQPGKGAAARDITIETHIKRTHYMHADFWLERWREGRTHFHLERVTPLLQKYWPGLGLPKGSKVLVPLCGKTLDMVWLAEQGHKVLGVELSPL